MEKLNERADMVHRDIEVNSQSSGGEKEPDKPKKRRTKKIPEPPTRKQSMGTDPIEISSPSQDSFRYSNFRDMTQSGNYSIIKNWSRSIFQKFG